MFEEIEFICMDCSQMLFVFEISCSVFRIDKDKILSGEFTCLRDVEVANS